MCPEVSDVRIIWGAISLQESKYSRNVNSAVECEQAPIVGHFIKKATMSLRIRKEGDPLIPIKMAIKMMQ